MKNREQGGEFLVFGEVLFDCFPDGVRVAGGAPFNVAWGLQGMGFAPLFISSVGDDLDGDNILRMMQEWGMRCDGLKRSSSHPTGIVTIRLEGGDASYTIPDRSAWDDISTPSIDSPKYIYHGLLSLRHETNRVVLQQIIEETSAQRFFDINLRPPYTPIACLEDWLQGTDWLKLNLEELCDVTGMACESLYHAEVPLNLLHSRYGVNNILLTAGSKGARVFGAAGDFTISPPPKPVQFVDTVGAGDAFSATILARLSQGIRIEECLKDAVEMASRVCSIQGALSPSKEFYRV